VLRNTPRSDHGKEDRYAMADSISRPSELIIKLLLKPDATIEEILAEAGSSAPSIRATWHGLKIAASSSAHTAGQRGGTVALRAVSLRQLLSGARTGHAAEKRRIACGGPSWSRPAKPWPDAGHTTTPDWPQPAPSEKFLHVGHHTLSTSHGACNQPGIRTF